MSSAALCPHTSAAMNLGPTATSPSPSPPSLSLSLSSSSSSPSSSLSSSANACTSTSITATPDTAPPKRRRRPPPIVVPPPTSLPTSFYPSPPPSSADITPLPAEPSTLPRLPLAPPTPTLSTAPFLPNVGPASSPCMHHHQHAHQHPEMAGIWRSDPRRPAAAASRKGRRRRLNEDRVFGRPDLGIFGVCDGHGADTTNSSQTNPTSTTTFSTPSSIIATPRFSTSSPSPSPSPSSSSSNNNIPAYKVAQLLPQLLAQGLSYTDAFQHADRTICQQYANKSFIGTTVTVARIDATTHSMSVAYVGDSRALLVSKHADPEYLTRDHLPTRPDEARRIEQAGGHVLNRRVNGVLAVSRAIGDRALKAVVPATPDVVHRRIGAHDELLVLASDGLWDMVAKADVVGMLGKMKCKAGTQHVPVDLHAAAERLVEQAVAKGSRDDTSVVLVDLTASMSSTSNTKFDTNTNTMSMSMSMS